MRPDWTQGFKVESDGTAAGTKVYDKDNNEVTDLRRFSLTWDEHRLVARSSHKAEVPPENP